MPQMSGYTKLFSSILASTIWREPMEVRIVWITLLAMAGRDGIAEGSVPGVADFARLPVSVTRASLERLCEPDPDSRSTEHEGRRIQPVDGGWLILNHAKYRSKLNADERREYLKIKAREYRRRPKIVNTSVDKRSGSSTQYTHAEAEAEATTDKIKTQDQDPPVRASRSLSKPTPEPEAFTRFWKQYPKRVGKGAALRAWAKNAPPLAAVLSSLEWQCRQPDWLRDQGQYIPHPATWLNRRGWEDEPFNAPAYEPPVQTKPGRGARLLQAGRNAIARSMEKQKGITDGTER